MLLVSIQPSEVINSSRLIREHGYINSSSNPYKISPFLLYLKKIIYLDVDHGRSWHLHVLHYKPDQPKGGLVAFIH